MALTDNLRQQHDAATTLVAAIELEIAGTGAGVECPDDVAWRISLLPAKLTGTLRFHLAAEDRALYPQLTASRDPEVAKLARHFVDEMGEIGPAFMAYSERWGRSTAIRDDFARFCRETIAVFAALGNRIDRENRELYPLADRVSATRAA